MSTLELLCNLHKQQGGTIHEFNCLYGIDFTTATYEELTNHWYEMDEKLVDNLQKVINNHPDYDPTPE